MSYGPDPTFARFAVVSLLGFALTSTAAATEREPRADDEWRVTSAGPLAVDAGLVMGPSMTLPSGLATGVGAGFSYGRRFSFGVRAGWSRATESSLLWTVTHDAYRLRATAEVAHAAGRGQFGLRLGVGGTVVDEARTRNQGARAGLTRSELTSSALALLPAGELEGVVSVHVAGPWFLTAGAGPSLLLEDGGLHLAWAGQLGAGWQP